MSDRDIPNVLLTGFEPFGGERINPSGEIARELTARSSMAIA